MFKLAIAIVIFLSNCPKSDSSRILCVFPIPLVSRQAVYRSLTGELLRRGHELVVVTTHPRYPKDGTPSNFTEINVFHSSGKESFGPMFDSNVKNPLTIAMPNIEEVLHNLFMNIYESEPFQKILKDGKFDLLILEEAVPSNIILSHLIKAPVVLVSSHGTILNYGITGAPTQEFIHPSILRRRIVNASFWEEIYEAYCLNTLENQFHTDTVTAVTGDNTPTMKELWNNVDMLLLNMFPVWEGIRPMPQSVVHAGAINIKSRKELPQDLQHYLNSSVNGVIYVSFGTSLPLSVLPKEKVQVMANVFSRLPYDVLWKWDKADIPGMGKNIKTFTWLPQADLLRHPKIKLLITHGGLHSTDEAIEAGVPIIGIPFVTDQFFNTENYMRLNIGHKLYFNSLTEESMYAAITKVIMDPSYRKNVIRLRTIMYDQPKTSLVMAADWVEYVLRHGGAKHLRPPAANMPWTQYLELELVCIVLVLVIIAVLFLVMLLYRIYRLLKRIF